MIAADVEKLKRLLFAERQGLVDFLVALERFDRLKMYEPMGYPGLWPFLQRELGLLKCMTYQRFWGCRMIRDYPNAIERLRDGRMALSTFVMLRDVLTPSNADRMFEEIAGKSRDDVKKLVEDLTAPVADPGEEGRRYTIRKAPLPVAVEASPVVAALRALSSDRAHPPAQAATPTAATLVEPTIGLPPPPASSNNEAPVPREMIVPSRTRPTQIEPTSGGFYDISMRVKERFVELLREAAKAESHVIPDGDPEALLTRGLEMIVDKYHKKIGKIPVRSSDKKGEADHDPDSDYIPADLLREVFERDGYKCVFPMANGGICGSERGLEGDHVTPRALGGKTEARNLRCVCHEHNQQAAREVFGAEHVARAIADARKQREKTPA